MLIDVCYVYLFAFYAVILGGNGINKNRRTSIQPFSIPHRPFVVIMTKAVFGILAECCTLTLLHQSVKINEFSGLTIKPKL